MQSRIKHLLKHFALVLKAKLNQLKPFVRFVFHPSTLLSSPTYRIIKGLRIQTLFILLYASFSCPYFRGPGRRRDVQSLRTQGRFSTREAPAASRCGWPAGDIRPDASYGTRSARQAAVPRTRGPRQRPSPAAKDGR